MEERWRVEGLLFNTPEANGGKEDQVEMIYAIIVGSADIGQMSAEQEIGRINAIDVEREDTFEEIVVLPGPILVQVPEENPDLVPEAIIKEEVTATDPKAAQRV
eukprot:TRINITY_DN14011_c0_g1_i1.p3 TRINITY_DN14011_c0_g1~~TRINITY_DN14011_c0_g1_i1.p3  ORF type:complete len:104 (+),score=19.27 TRINITY_DN14011_c0_g1_i1:198-509(+)